MLQLGLTIAIPIVGCVLVCRWLCVSFGIGIWIYIPGFVMGVGAAAMTWYRLYRKYNKKSSEKKPFGFNDHV